ncbi:hypothetical protein LDENG_00064980 [Lucifuga dentata]|nr:hypothetical protein LDENG_00064980 [Lucifuga dentata]
MRSLAPPPVALHHLVLLHDEPRPRPTAESSYHAESDHVSAAHETHRILTCSGFHGAEKSRKTPTVGCTRRSEAYFLEITSSKASQLRVCIRSESYLERHIVCARMEFQLYLDVEE